MRPVLYVSASTDFVYKTLFLLLRFPRKPMQSLSTIAGFNLVVSLALSREMGTTALND